MLILCVSARCTRRGEPAFLQAHAQTARRPAPIARPRQTPPASSDFLPRRLPGRPTPAGAQGRVLYRSGLESTEPSERVAAAIADFINAVETGRRAL